MSPLPAALTPSQRLEANRLRMHQVLQTGPWPEWHMLRRAARQMSQRHPVATVVVVAVGAALLFGSSPWRWLRPGAALKVALAQWAWRTAQGWLQAAVQQRTPLQGPSAHQAGRSKKA